MPSYPLNPVPGLPAKITVSLPNVALARGATAQLSPILYDAYGTAVSPTHPFTFTSSNPALVSVNATGLCIAASGDANELQTGGIAEIEVLYPWAGGSSDAMIHSTVTVTVTVPPGVYASIYTPAEAGCWRPFPKLYPSA